MPEPIVRDAAEAAVPEVLGRCEDPELIGAPFFLMSHIPGATINDGLPAARVRIDILEVLSNDLTRKQIAMTRAWAALHQDELEENWRRARGTVKH